MTLSTEAQTPDPIAALGGQCVVANLPWRDAWLQPVCALATLLLQESARTNLVGDASAAGLVEHVIEALALAAATESALGRAPGAVVDVGSGAGLEALTLALVWPQARVVAVEPRALRHAFIAQAVAAMRLRNVAVVGKSLHGAALTAEFDLAVARAVWPVAQWLPRGRALLAPAGVVGVHGPGPAADLAKALPKDWRVAAVRDVPGVRAHAVAVLKPLPQRA